MEGEAVEEVVFVLANGKKSRESIRAWLLPTLFFPFHFALLLILGQHAYPVIFIPLASLTFMLLLSETRITTLESSS